MERTIEHIKDNWDIEMKEMAEKFEKQNLSFFSRLMENKDQFNLLHDNMMTNIGQIDKQLDHLTKVVNRNQ